MCDLRGICFACRVLPISCFGFTLLRFRYTDDVLITESLSVTKHGIVALILQTTVSVSLLVDVSFAPRISSAQNQFLSADVDTAVLTSVRKY